VKPVQRFGARFAIPVYLGFVLTGVVTTLLGPLLPILSLRWSLTDGQAGGLFTAQFAGSVLGAVLTAWLLPKSGHRLAFGMGFLLMAMGIGMLALGAKSFGMAGIVGYGLGQGVTIPVSNLLVSERDPQRRASVLNLLNFAWGIGAVVCPFFIASANRAGNLFGWLLGLAVMLGMVALCAGLLTSPEPRSSHHQDSESSWGRRRGTVAFVLGALFFLYVGTETALGGWVTSHAKRTDASHLRIWVFAPALFWGSLLLGRALAPLFLHWLAERRLVVLDLLLAGSGIVILLTAGSGQGILIGSAVAGFGLSSVFPITIALLSCLGSKTARAAGLLFALGGLGGAIVPWLVGLAAMHSGSLRAALVLPLIAVVLMTALHLLVAAPADADSFN
jgi:fucose permease